MGRLSRVARLAVGRQFRERNRIGVYERYPSE
jgi:hypothetical protein